MSGRKFILGEISYLDFLAWEFFDHIAIFFPEVIEGKTNIFAFYQAFAEIPKISTYINSEEFQKAKLYGPGKC